jgi:threonylcarbamoyladenosine tRNA methylthiotransferase MtaB
MKKFLVKTLGCKANAADGQLLEVGLTDLGFASTRDPSEADFVIVNSCTVTDEADKQSQKMVRDAVKKNPNVKVIYTGCAAEVDPELAASIRGVSAVIGNQDKTRAASLIQEFMADSSVQTTPPFLGGVSSYAELASRHPMDREWTMPESGIDEILKLGVNSSTVRTRAFIKIQEGCNAFCTYCIIPYGRGPARSLPLETLIEKISNLVQSGMQEVILTGTNIGDYGIDWPSENGAAYSHPPMIDDLIEAILTRTEVKRLRVSSLDPTEISDRMIALMEEHENFCPHFHVSLQNVNSKVLKLMKRKYSFTEVKACLDKLSMMKRKPFVGMDYITGFPGESAADFSESVEVLKSLYWTRMHVFPYSERENTPATKLPNVVPAADRKTRARTLQALSLERLTAHYAKVRSTSDEQDLLHGVLVESAVKGPDGTRNWVAGYSPNYQRVILPITATALSRQNEIVSVQVKRWLVDRASGEVCWFGEWVS